MRDAVPDPRAVHGPPGAVVDEYSPTAAPLRPAKSAAPASVPVTPVVGGVLGSLGSLSALVELAGGGRPPSATTEAATGVPRRVDDPVDALVGTILADRYRIDRKLGAGGMGAVYAGFHVTLNKRIALKVVQPRLGADATIAQRFVQEARAASAIGHEHIVQITDFGRTADDAAFIVMEYLDGEDLAETLRREGPLPWPRVVHIGEQIAWALAAAHRQGIVHRDIKPANCYRVPREQDPDFIKVLDFGLAKVLAEQRDGESLTGTGMLLGTPGYIAPELYRGLKADHRVDIYALGALMHKLLTGDLPPMAAGSGNVDALAHVNVPGAVQAVLARAIAEAPDDRYATAQELAQALRAIPRVSPDEPTMLTRLDEATSPRTGPRAALHDPSSAQAVTLREPTPSTFPSLFTVERDGHRVRFYIGAPLIFLLVAGVGALVFFLTRPDPYLAWAQQRAKIATAEAFAEKLGAFPTSLPVAAPAPEPPAPAPAPAVVSPPAPAVEPPAPAVEPPAPAVEPPAEPTPTPVTAPPVAPSKPKKGSPGNLAAYLSRKCLDGGFISFKVDLAWKADEAGLLIPDSVAAKPGDDRDITVCALRELRRSRFQWKPLSENKHTLTLGQKPATPPAP